jgi:hypothetical protein
MAPGRFITSCGGKSVNRNKLRAVVATGAAAAVLGIAGFAFAAFTQDQAANATGRAEQFDPITVSALPLSGAMLPGESSPVALTLTNPSGNSIKAKVVSISPEPTPVTITVINNSADTAYCASMIVLKSNDANNVLPLPTINGNTDANYNLNSAVTFKEEMDSRCEGMEFKTNWVVQFQAVRA